jgi:hypothetical protein
LASKGGGYVVNIYVSYVFNITISFPFLNEYWKKNSTLCISPHSGLHLFILELPGVLFSPVIFSLFLITYRFSINSGFCLVHQSKIMLIGKFLTYLYIISGWPQVFYLFYYIHFWSVKSFLLSFKMFLIFGRLIIFVLWL